MKLVPEFTGPADIWRWYSLRAAAFGVAFSAAWLAVPDDLRAGVPDWVGTSIALATFVCVFVGRLVPQSPEKPE